MKQIYTLLAATLMLAGTALWSGCSNNELLENEKPGTEKPGNQQAAGFKFNLKGMAKTNTRATVEELTKPSEIKINTLYVAFFLNDGNQQEGNYLLHKIFAYDAAITFGQPSSAWQNDTEITKTADTEDYVIASPGKVGDYMVYFIANPDEDMKTKFAEYQLSGGADGTPRTKLSDFEVLKAKSGTADGTVKEGNPSTERGFIMLAKQSITLSTSAATVKDINLTRLAARFDFINSAATTQDSKVKITKITINNAARQSRLMELATISQEELQAQTVDLTSWTDQTAYISAYTYENLNLKDANANDRLSIDIEYELTAGNAAQATKMKKQVQLIVGESDLAVLRNHIYRIYMNGVTGEFSVEVQDWNEGATVIVPDGNLDIVYTAKDLGKVGDYVYVTTTGELAFSDGGLRKSNLNGTLEWDADLDNIKPVTGKGTCVGFVFSNRVSEKDKAKGWTGYAITTRANSIPGYAWCTGSYTTADNPNIPNVTTVKEMVNDMDGYSHCQAMETEGIDSYPMYKTFKLYTASLTSLPAETSGWYMPSVGQFAELCYNIAGITSLHTTSQDKDLTGTSKAFSGGNYAFANSFSQKIDNKNVLTSGLFMVTSSELDATRFVHTYTYTNSLTLYGMYTKADTYTINTYYVFAFPKPQNP